MNSESEARKKANIIRELLKGSASRFFLFIANVVSGLFMMPYLIQSLGKEQYGLWVLASSIISFYSLLDMGVYRAMHRFLMQAIYKNDDHLIQQSLSTNVVLGAILGVVSLVVTITLVVSTPYIVEEAQLRDSFVAIIILLGARTSIEFPLYAFFGILMAKYKYHIIGNIQLAALVARVAMIVLLVENGAGVVGLAIASVVTMLMANIYIVKLAIKELGSGVLCKDSFCMGTLKKYLSFGKYTYAIAVSKKITESLDTIVVNSLLGLASVTHYSVASSLVQYFTSAIGSVFGVISSVLNKHVADGNNEDLLKTFAGITELTVLVAVYIGGGLLLLGREFIEAWVGQEFVDSYELLKLLIIPAVFSAAQFTSLEVLIAKARHKQQAYVSILEVVVNAVLSIYLGQIYGMVGVAYATMIAITMNALFILPIYACRQIHMSVVAYYKIHGRLYFFASITAVIFLAFKEWYGVIGFADVFIGGMVYSVIYFVIYFFVFMPKNLKMTARSVMASYG